MIAETQIEQLQAIVIKELSSTAELLTILNKEKVALASRNIPEIEQLIEEKFHLSQQLEELEDSRKETLSTLESDNPDIWQELLNANTSMKESWNNVLLNLRMCRDANLASGAILELGKHQTDHALSILRGQQDADKSYGSSGKTSSDYGHRELGKA